MQTESKNTTREVRIVGEIIGPIWWPVGEEFTKPIRLSNQQYPFTAYVGGKATLRDMALQATNDGDFQYSRLSLDTVVVFRRVRRMSDGHTVTIERTMPVTVFPSIGDCVEAFEGEVSHV